VQGTIRTQTAAQPPCDVDGRRVPVTGEHLDADRHQVIDPGRPEAAPFSDGTGIREQLLAGFLFVRGWIA
jgi:hypothetical protein